MSDLSSPPQLNNENMKQNTGGLHDNTIILAVPKGRIFQELSPILNRVGIIPEAAFAQDESRQLRFATNIPYLDIIRVRSFDVASFVAFGAAQLGVVGLDVLEEFYYDEVYAPLDLGIGRCHLSLAGKSDADRNLSHYSHLKISTKYPDLTRRYFAQIGVEAECIKLNGALELAPQMGLSDYIVDLVSSGATLRANGLVEIEKILDVSARLIVNRTCLKTRSHLMSHWLKLFKDAVAEHRP